ncbi:TetR family transcriptional regulator [Streptomyces sp. MP131-18]|uniref:TetR/AcrR family transcriptional regulator n=1 Tax=Streptomyces sp. MP131-18 TaxID=1857892 RepID=UPI0009A224B6|nr:TetR family transcriptional regulator [Streptomyces sp. MP131-18]ONK10870.1 transcriptional regulator BetI [Streptomyces sp. MP131-18]
MTVERAPVSGSGKRPGRRPGKTVSRQVILSVAMKRFAEVGYEGVSLRSIAREAQVDPALVRHFFASKEGLFEAVMRDAFHPEDFAVVVEGGEERMGERLVAGFLEMWETQPSRDKLLSVLRSAVTRDAAANMVRSFIVGEVLAPITRAIGRPHPQARAALVGTQLVGVALARYVVKTQPLPTMRLDAVVQVIAPSIQRFLTGDLPDVFDETA